MKRIKEFFLRVTLAIVLFVAPAMLAGTGAPFTAQMVQGLSSPQELAGLAAWYDISDASSLIYDGSNRVALVSDKSGNSAVNVLVLNGVSTNFAYTSAQSFANIDVRARVMATDYTPAALMTITGQWDPGTSQQSWIFVINTDGTLAMSRSTTGINSSTIPSSSVPPLVDFTVYWLRMTFDGTTGTVTFYWAADTGSNATEPSSWTSIGGGSFGAGNLFAASSRITVGAFRDAGSSSLFTGNIFTVKPYTSIGGATPVVNFDPSSAAKLASSVVASTGETWTINSTGATGARISGARDLYQGTVANQPILTIDPLGNYLTFDGSNDYLKSAAFSQPQPVTRLTVGSHATWTSGDYLWDGASAANTGALIQTTTTPQLNLNAGSSVAANTDFTLNTRFIFTEVINGASSSLQADKLTATTGNAGAGVPNGITIGASGATPAANFGNITFSERVSYGSLTAAQIASVRQYLARKWSISGGFALAPVIPMFTPDRTPAIALWKREELLAA